MHDNENDAVLCANIRRISGDKGIKHCKLASACGMTSQEFSRMLAGKRLFRTCYIPSIVSVLGCSYNDLFTSDRPA